MVYWSCRYFVEACPEGLQCEWCFYFTAAIYNEKMDKIYKNRILYREARNWEGKFQNASCTCLMDDDIYCIKVLTIERTTWLFGERHTKARLGSRYSSKQVGWKIQRGPLVSTDCDASTSKGTISFRVPQVVKGPKNKWLQSGVEKNTTKKKNSKKKGTDFYF